MFIEVEKHKNLYSIVKKQFLFWFKTIKFLSEIQQIIFLFLLEQTDTDTFKVSYCFMLNLQIFKFVFVELKVYEKSNIIIITFALKF